MSDRAELSALATSLEEMVARVGELAGNLTGAAREDVAPELFEVERALIAASRRLARAVESL